MYIFYVTYTVKFSPCTSSVKFTSVFNIVMKNQQGEIKGQTQGLEGAGRIEVAETLALAASQSQFASSSCTFAVAELHL